MSIKERPTEEGFEKGFIVVSNKDQIRGGQATRIVHLANRSVMDKETMRGILEANPNITAIQTAKSNVPFMRSKMRKLLNEKGVAIMVGRVLDFGHYDNTPVTLDYLNKKRAFEEMLKDPVKKDVFARMQENEFDESEIAIMYFGEERLSVREIAERLGLAQRNAQRKLTAFLHWMGIPSQDQRIQIRVNYLIHRLNRLEAIKVSSEAREGLRESCKVGDKYPPFSLAPARWEMWQKVYSLYTTNPSLFEKLRVSHPRSFKSLAEYFQLEEAEGVRVPMRVVGEQLGVSRQRIKELTNQALRFLGVLEETSKKGRKL